MRQFDMAIHRKCWKIKLFYQDGVKSITQKPPIVSSPKHIFCDLKKQTNKQTKQFLCFVDDSWNNAISQVSMVYRQTQFEIIAVHFKQAPFIFLMP